MSDKAQKHTGKTTVATEKGLYTLGVSLIGGPVTEKFAKANPVVSRTIQIRGDQTLEDLHNAIFEAFDREEEHMYEFQFGGKRPNDPKAKQYVLPIMIEDGPSDGEYAGDLTETKIGSLGLKKDDVFGYWFDYGDDWWHQIDVVELDAEATPTGRFPQVTARTGDSPPQYADVDEEEEEQEDDSEDEDECEEDDIDEEEYEEEEEEEEYEDDEEADKDEP